jgi:hypothetical protein
VSQVKSAVHAIAGDEESAKKTQVKFLKTMGGVVDGVPIAGHIKGGIHYAVGDSESGDNAMKSASRTVGEFIVIFKTSLRPSLRL